MNPRYKYAGVFPLIALTILISTSLSNASKYRVRRTHENVPGNNFKYKSNASNVNANANTNNHKRKLRGSNLNTIATIETRKLSCGTDCLGGMFDDQDDTPVEDLYDDQDDDVPGDDDGAVDDDVVIDDDVEEIPNGAGITDQLNPALFADQSKTKSMESSNTENDPQPRIESESTPEPEPEPVSQPETKTSREDLNFDMTNYAKNTDSNANNSEGLSSGKGSGTVEQKEAKKVTGNDPDPLDDPIETDDTGLDMDDPDGDMDDPDGDMDDPDGDMDDPDGDMDDPDVGEETDDENDDDGEDEDQVDDEVAKTLDAQNENPDAKNDNVMEETEVGIDGDNEITDAVDDKMMQEIDEDVENPGEDETDDNMGIDDDKEEDKVNGGDDKTEDNADKGVVEETPSPTKSPRTKAPHRSPTRAPHRSPTTHPTKSPTPQPTTSPTTMSWGKKIAAEEQEIKDIATNNTADAMAGVIAFLGIVGMLLTAWQLFENPDGLCASCCRLSLKVSAFLLKIICLPCKLCCGRYSGYTTSDPKNRTVFLEKAEEYTNDLELT